MLAKNTKIKTSGLKLILKKLDYQVAVSVKRTDSGYKTSLLATAIVNTIKIANNEVRLFGNCTLKEMFVALTDIKKIKEFYSLNERAYKIFKEIDSVM